MSKFYRADPTGIAAGTRFVCLSITMNVSGVNEIQMEADDGTVFMSLADAERFRALLDAKIQQLKAKPRGGVG